MGTEDEDFCPGSCPGRRGRRQARLRGLPRIRGQQLCQPMVLDPEPRPHCGQGGSRGQGSFDATVLKQLTVGTKVDIKMVKDGLPLPCLPVPGLPIHVGSCNYDAEDLLALITPEDCKKFAPEGQACC